MARTPAPSTGSRFAGIGRFARRAVALAAIGVVAVALLGAQLVRLAVVEHATHRANVERYLVNRRLLPAPRGRILDRQGRVLAADRAGWDVLLEYDAIVGRWSSAMARRALVRELGRPQWLELSAAERTNALLARQADFDARLEQVFGRLIEAGGIDRAELDRRLDAIVARTAREARSRKEALVARETRLYGEDARLGDVELERIGAELDAHVILSDVTDETAFYFQRLAEELPGTVVVEPSTRRWNPWSQVRFEQPRDRFPKPIREEKSASVVLDGVADHVVGGVRAQVFPEDLARRPMADPATGAIVDLGGYRADRDVVGAYGAERRGEDLLRGIRGLVVRDLERDAETRTEPLAGRDIELTIDISLAARLQALFAPEVGLARISQYQRGFDAEGNPRGGPLPLGWELDGAIVVVEIATGEILAAVSSPTLAEGALMPEARRAAEHPEIFRPLEALYPPGSILKPLVFCAAAAEGLVGAGESITCNGHYFPDRNDLARCWTYRANEGKTATHGPLDAREALARSCNIYFYTLAARLGPERLVSWLGRFGLGERPDTGLAVSRTDGDGTVRIGGEAAGMLPDPAEIEALRKRGDRVSPLLLGIGQGPIAWTPVQAAASYATIARGGRVLPVRIVRGLVGEREPRDLRIPRSAIDAALGGLRDSVREPYGTGHHLTLEGGVREPLFAIDGVDVWGKTGTATAALLPLDGNRDGVVDTRVRTDHAWFVGLAGPKGGAPTHSIAVVMDYGGSGGKVAGPVAAQAIRALAAEGYLGEGARAAAAASASKEAP